MASCGRSFMPSSKQAWNAIFTRQVSTSYQRILLVVFGRKPRKLLFKSGCKACLVARTGRADPNVAQEGAKIGEVGFAQHKVQILKKLALVP
jgi:hypothetical protein